MYNKLFTKILDSSIWLEPTPTRIVWVTLLAAMDEDGFCSFASVANVAHRAVVSREEAESAIKTLESPDPNSSDPGNDGRRIERVPGGWYVLNAPKYRELATREQVKAGNKERQRKHRATRDGHELSQPVTPCHASVTDSHETVTPSEAYTEAEAVNPTGEEKASWYARIVMEGMELSGKDVMWLVTDCIELLAKKDEISYALSADTIVARWQAYDSTPREKKFGKLNWLKTSEYLTKTSPTQKLGLSPAEKLRRDLEEDNQRRRRSAGVQ